MQATSRKFPHLIMDLAKAFIQPLLDEGVEGLLFYIFFQFWRQPVPVTGGSFLHDFPFLFLTPSFFFHFSFHSFFLHLACFFSSFLVFFLLRFLTFWVHKRIAALDLRAAFYAQTPVTLQQSDTSMRSPSTNGSASREVGVEPRV